MGKYKVGGIRAQAGVLEFLVLILVMLFILQQSLVLAGKSKHAGILLLERMMVERSADQIEFAVEELGFSGYGRKTIEIPQQPFITYFIPLAKADAGSMLLGASFEDIAFTTDIDLHDARLSCSPGNYPNLTIRVENWGQGVEVLC